jgi:hypothetical protein
VAIERKARIGDIKAARAYSVKLVKAALATVNRDAASGYNSDRGRRESLITRLADEIATRNPAIRGLVKDLIKVLLDAIEIDDPLIRVALNTVLAKVVNSLGVDKVAGNLLTRLIDGIAGHGKPGSLRAVTADIAVRLSYLETQQAEFMEHGGPEIMQAGDEWKEYASLLGTAAIVGFFAQAVAAPDAWARELSDTAGVVIDDTVGAVVSLIAKV